jgi:two-component system NtrC family sensor kinase
MAVKIKDQQTDLHLAAKPALKNGWPILFLGPLCLLIFGAGLWLLGAVRATTAAAILLPVLLLFGLLAWPFWTSLRRQMSKLEQERDAFYQELLRNSRAAGLGELASSIAHDLNNPLAIMHEEAGWIQDLLRKPDAKGQATLEEIANSAAQIEIQIRRSRDITKRILDWTREGGARTERSDFNSLFNKTLYLIEGELQPGGVKVVKDFAEGIPPVQGSACEWQQVFLNLIKNALDAMRPSGGGVLTLATRDEGGFVRATIRDNGPGIEPEKLERIFDPFFTTKQPGEGTGLGLPISRWIAKKQGGRIEVESVPGQGAVFHVLAPKADKALGGEEPQSRDCARTTGLEGDKNGKADPPAHRG